MKVGLIQDFKLEKILDIDESELHYYATRYQYVYDLTNYNPLPPVGTSFDGKVLANPLAQVKRITRLAMRQRFTVPELITILEASKTDPVIEILLGNIQVSTYVDLTRTETIQGVMYLAQQGIITLERAQAILNNEVQEIERYIG